MALTVIQVAGTDTFQLEGDLVVAEVAHAKPLLMAAMAAAGDRFRLDVGGVGECDTAGVQLLLMVRASASSQGSRFEIIHAPAPLLGVLERLGLPRSCFYEKRAP